MPRTAREEEEPEGMLPEFVDESLGFRCIVRVVSGGAKAEAGVGSGSA